jgi:hypothetical protein
VKKGVNIDYRADSTEASAIVIVIARGPVNLAMAFVIVIDVLEWMRDDRKKEVDQVEVVGGKGKLIYSWWVIQVVRKEGHV